MPKKRNILEAKSRACWNPALETSLVMLLHEHNNTGFRDGNNKWTSKAWKKIVKEFNERNKCVSFTNMQIQDREREMKRDYRILKEARTQRGFTWNEDRCMIEAEPALWEKLIITFPKAKKFRNNKASFPLFDELRELYDGHPAEAIYNCTSNELPQYSPLRQVDNTYEGYLEEVMAYDVEDDDTEVQITEDEAGSSERNEQMLQTRVDSVSRHEDDEAASAERNGQKRIAATESRNKEEREAKRPKKSGTVEGLMKRHHDMRRKQVEDEAAQVAKIKEAAQGTDFSIKKCISVLNSMEVSKEEKAKAYAVFKNQDNREIFLSACSEDPESALIWLRNEMA